MHTRPRPSTGATLPIDAVLSRQAAHRWQGRGGAPVQTAREWSRHDQGGRRRIDPRISAWLPSARSSRRDGQAAQRAAAGTGELLWARTQLSHTGPVPTGPRGRARQHRVAGAGWRDARGQHISSVPTLWVWPSAPGAVHLTAPPRDTAGAFSTHPRCLSTPYMRILAIYG